jgi:PIN domain nuclease of toxin-antitoxin system
MSQTSARPSALLLDTHVWVRYVNGTPGLKTAIVSSIEAARVSGKVFVSIISVWEIAMLARKGRLTFPRGVLAWVEEAMRMPGIHMLPLTVEIAVHSVELPREMNNDPSDRFLVATAQLENLQLVTLDVDIVFFAKTFKLPLLTL